MDARKLLELYTLEHRDFSGADLRNVDLSGANLSGVNLSDANLSGANLSQTNFVDADLSESNLSSANLSLANLSGANLSKSNLSESNLSGTNLSGADLANANLIRADLSEANLVKAILYGANLREANLCRSNLAYALFFCEFELNSTKLLFKADLRNADLSDANLVGANLTNAKLNGTKLDGTILSQSGSPNSQSYSNQGVGAKYTWEKLRFRSNEEIEIASALDSRGVLFYPNCKARLKTSTGQENKETDFLVFYQGKWGILEVDGEPWHPPTRTVHDHERDRLFKVHGIRVVEHYDANRCWNEPDRVVQEFLEILSRS